MKIRLIFLSATIVFLFNSCNKNANDNSLPYYQFTEDDKTKLLVHYDIGKEFIYKNQDNGQIKFKVVEAVNGKTSYAVGTFWGSSAEVYFYYDRQEIVMEYAEGYAWSNCEFNLQRYPVGSNYLIQYPVIGTPTFTGYIRFPLWNSYSDTLSLNNSIFIDFNSNITSITINGKTYSKVRILQSGSTEILEPNNTFPALPKNVNKIYYDQNAGIIGFDDLSGKQWRLQ